MVAMRMFLCLLAREVAEKEHSRWHASLAHLKPHGIPSTCTTCQLKATRVSAQVHSLLI